VLKEFYEILKFMSGDQSKISTDEIKIVISMCDSKVNGSLAGLVAVVFGEFGILRLYENVPIFSSIITGCNTFIMNGRWWGLTLTYIFLGVLGLFLAYRAIVYSELSARAGDQLDREENGVIHHSTKKIFDNLIDRMESTSGWDKKLKHWAVRQETWLKFFVIVLYLLPFLAVAIRL